MPSCRMAYFQAMGYPKWSDRVVLVLAVLVWLASNGPVRSQTFGPPQVILDSIGSAEPFFEDANADGIPDLFIQQDSVVQIYLNDGTGVFTLAELVQIPDRTLRNVADMNGDGHGDLFLRRNDSLFVRYFGLLDTSEHFTGNRVSFGWYYIEDLDSDGDEDITWKAGIDFAMIFISTNWGLNGFAVDSFPVVNDGGGTVVGYFQPFDWNKDSAVDLTAGEGLNGNLLVSYSVNGSYGYPFITFLAGAGVASRGVVADIDADGDLDYFLNSVYRSLGNGAYQIVGITGNFLEYVPSQLDCDPELELSGLGTNYPDLFQYYSYSDAGLQEVEYLIDSTSLDDFVLYAVVDLDQNGLDDLVNRSGPSLVVRFNTTEVPEVTITLPDTVLLDTRAYPLSGGLPQGGVYSGSGVFNDVFYPVLLGAGSHEITYTFTDPISGCWGSATAVIDIATGIDEQGVSMLPVHPVPSTTEVVVTLPQQPIGRWKVTDASGRTLLFGGADGGTPNTLRIDLSPFSPGVYWLVLDLGTGGKAMARMLHIGDQ